jgi:hypothetical protein
MLYVPASEKALASCLYLTAPLVSITSLACKEDMMTDLEFDHLWEEITGGASNAQEPQELDEEETAPSQSEDEGPFHPEEVAEVEGALDSYLIENDWPAVSKTHCPDGNIYYNVYMNISNVSLHTAMLISDKSLSLQIIVTLPTVCSPQYWLILDDFIVNFNYSRRFGGLRRSQGTVDYVYSFSVSGGFNEEHFQRYLAVCIFSAVEAYPEIAKLSVGKLSRKKSEELVEKLRVLVEALKE